MEDQVDQTVAVDEADIAEDGVDAETMATKKDDEKQGFTIALG